jgi:methionyl-tRNA formyltransferase
MPRRANPSSSTAVSSDLGRTSQAAIVIASPHGRNDATEEGVRRRLPDYEVIRVRNREELSREALQPIEPAFVFFPHWSWLVPADVYSRFPCVIFHMTDVPYGRGGSPLQNLIVRGHEATMISAIDCVKEIDAGAVYLKRPLSLAGTAEQILQRASSIVEDMIVEIVRSRPIPVPQEGPVVAFKRRTPAEGDLAALADVGQVYDYIRMLDGEGYPRAFVRTPHLHLEFSDARHDGDFVEARVRIRKQSE